MSSLLRLLWLFVLLVPWGAQAQGWLAPFTGQQESEFLEAKDVFRVAATAGDDGRTLLRGEIAPGYYLYRHRLSVVGKSGALPLTLSKGKEKTDEFFGRTEVYHDAVDITVDGGGATSAVLHWQGCADAGICYPPQTMRVELPFVAKTAVDASATDARTKMLAAATAAQSPQSAPVAAATMSATPVSATQPAALESAAGSTMASASAAPAPAATGEDQQFASRLANASLAASIAVFFGMGLLLAFTPCTLPMIPIVSSLIVGGQPTPRRALALSAAYVLPMALTYAALGVGAGLAGANLQAALQNPWLLGAFAAVFVVLALAMFGAFELQLPAWLNNRLARAGRHQQGGTLAGAAVLGLLSALLVGPCMTAPLAGALLYIGQSGSALTGGLALFALGLGMGLPLLLIAMFGARILPRPGAWMDRIKAVFGYLLLALAISMLARVLSPATVLVLWGAWLLAIAAGFAAMAAPIGSGPLRQWWPRYFAAASAIWALALMLGGASGGSDPMRPLAGFGAGVATAQATAAPGVAYVQVKTADDVARRIAEAGARGQWTLVDFYADWCVSCHVI
ncbi:MAG: protein-disulfide reductase DsbD, partial [Lysobacter sp.]